MSNKPLILTDNLFENVLLHPTFSVGSFVGVDVASHEPFRVADNLRDMTWWTDATPNVADHLHVDVGAGLIANPNTLILERGHNLAGKSVTIGGWTDTTFGTAVYTIGCTIPAVAGGVPSDPNGCLTPDGVWWKTYVGVAARVHSFSTPALGAGVSPIITGLYLGTSYRFSEYLNAPAAYDYGTNLKYMNNQLSRGGVRVKSRPINMDKLAIALDVESTDYQGFENEIRRVLRYNAPMWFAFDDSDVSADAKGQMRMFQLAGDVTYNPQVNPVHREIRVEFEECIPTLYA